MSPEKMNNINKIKDTVDKMIDGAEVEKSKSHIIVEIIQYIPNAVLSKTIIKKWKKNSIGTCPKCNL